MTEVYYAAALLFSVAAPASNVSLRFFLHLSFSGVFFFFLLPCFILKLWIYSQVDTDSWGHHGHSSSSTYWSCLEGRRSHMRGRSSNRLWCSGTPMSAQSLQVHHLMTKLTLSHLLMRKKYKTSFTHPYFLRQRRGVEGRSGRHRKMERAGEIWRKTNGGKCVDKAKRKATTRECATANVVVI